MNSSPFPLTLWVPASSAVCMRGGRKGVGFPGASKIRWFKCLFKIIPEYVDVAYFLFYLAEKDRHFGIFLSDDSYKHMLILKDHMSFGLFRVLLGRNRLLWSYF